MDDKSPAELVSVISQAQYVIGLAPGLKEAMAIVRSEAMDAFSVHDDLMAERLRAVMDLIRSRSEARQQHWEETYHHAAEVAWEKIENLDDMPAVAGWLQVLANAEESEEKK